MSTQYNQIQDQGTIKPGYIYDTIEMKCFFIYMCMRYYARYHRLLKLNKCAIKWELISTRLHVKFKCIVLCRPILPLFSTFFIATITHV